MLNLNLTSRSGKSCWGEDVWRHNTQFSALSFCHSLPFTQQTEPTKRKSFQWRVMCGTNPLYKPFSNDNLMLKWQILHQNFSCWWVLFSWNLSQTSCIGNQRRNYRVKEILPDFLDVQARNYKNNWQSFGFNIINKYFGKN